MSRSSGLEDKPESARIKNERSNGLDTEYSSGLVNFIGSFDTRKRAITAPPARRTPGVRIGNNPAESPVPRPARNTHCNKRPHGLPCTYRAYSGTDTGRPWLSLCCTALALAAPGTLPLAILPLAIIDKAISSPLPRPPYPRTIIRQSRLSAICRWVPPRAR